MANEQDKVAVPFTTFNFSIEITVPDLTEGNATICSAAFSECTGLELSMAPKTIREGGNNLQQIHLVGPVSFGQLTLKRGMTKGFDLWRWFDMALKQGKERTRGSGSVVMLPESGDQDKPQVVFSITGCLPIKLRAPSLNAATTAVAIEEMQIAYETLTIDYGSSEGA